MNKPIIAALSPSAVELEEGKTYYFCSCGKSKNQPFCDGAHARTGLTPQAFTADKTGTAYLCACKASSNTPFCDGSHSKFSSDQVGEELP